MTLLSLYQYILDPVNRKPYQNVNRWFQTIINQPQSIAVLGNFKLADKALEFDPKKYAEMQGGKVNSFFLLSSVFLSSLNEHVINLIFFVFHKQSKKGKKEKETQPPKEKEPKKEEKKEDKKEETEEAPVVAKGMDFDDFKRFYSNEDTDKSIPYFFEKFDPEECSIWFAEYKYPEELQKVNINL